MKKKKGKYYGRRNCAENGTGQMVTQKNKGLKRPCSRVDGRMGKREQRGFYL